MQSPDESIDYWVTGACIGFEEDLERLMDREGMSRADLAREYGASTAFISKVLNGTTNYTLKTMAKLGRAVRAVLQVRLISEDDEVVRILTLDDAELFDSLHAGRKPPQATSTLRSESDTIAEVIQLSDHRERKLQVEAKPIEAISG